MRLGPRRISIAVLAAWGVIAGTSDTSAREPRVPALALDAIFGDPVGALLDAQYPLTLRLRNVGARDAFVNARMSVGVEPYDHEVSIVATGPDRRRLEVFRLGKGSEPSADFRTLRPGDALYAYVDLAEVLDLSRPGTYRVQAVYENRADPPAGGSAWKGTVASRVVRFRRR